MKYLGTAKWICAKFTRKMCLISHLDEFEGQGQRSRSPGTKTAFSALLAACMQFVFSKTTLASSLTHLLWSYSIFGWIFQNKISDNNRLDTLPVAKHVKAALK